MSEPKKILVIDDEKDLAQILSMKLSQHGYSTQTAHSESEASTLLSETEFDLVMSDVRMPGGTGIDLLKSMRKSGLTTPVVLLSGYTDISLKEALQMGACDLITKPVDFVYLDKRVQKSLMTKDDIWKDSHFFTEKPNLEFQESFEDSDFGETLRVGSGGFSFVSENPGPIKDQFVSFKIKYANKTIAGNGLMRWSQSVGGKSQVGIEVDCFFEGKEFFLQMNDNYPNDSFIPEL